MWDGVGPLSEAASAVVGLFTLLFIARQLLLQRRVSALEALRGVMVDVREVDTMLLDRPHLIPVFRGGAQPRPRSRREAELIAEMYADVLENGLHARRRIPGGKKMLDDWEPYARWQLRAAPVLTEVVVVREWWPQLLTIMQTCPKSYPLPEGALERLQTGERRHGCHRR